MNYAETVDKIVKEHMTLVVERGELFTIISMAMHLASGCEPGEALQKCARDLDVFKGMLRDRMSQLSEMDYREVFHPKDDHG